MTTDTTTILYSADWTHPLALVRDGGIDDQFIVPLDWSDEQISARFRNLGMDEAGPTAKALTACGYSFTWSWRRVER